jgi:two-component system, sensor histidine kinase and response regulator
MTPARRRSSERNLSWRSASICLSHARVSGDWRGLRLGLGIVKSSADTLLTVINDILDFSKIEAGRLERDSIDFDLRDAIGDTANALAWKAHQNGLELIVDVGAAVPHTSRGDAGRLRQILVNLLGNAIKFTPHGEVVLRVTSEMAHDHSTQ